MNDKNIFATRKLIKIKNFSEQLIPVKDTKKGQHPLALVRQTLRRELNSIWAVMINFVKSMSLKTRSCSGFSQL